MRIFMSGQDYNIRRMWQDAGHYMVNNIEDADVVQFIGGADVNPELYGEKQAIRTRTEPNHDKMDMENWRASRPHQLKIGICRGGQFLNVMNGGAMWQHVDGHGVAEGHMMIDGISGKEIRVTSTHHQMMIPHEKGEVIGFARGIAKNHYTLKPEGRKAGELDPEVVWYRDNNCLCFQPHPEYSVYLECRKYFFELIDKLYEPKKVS